MVNLYGAFVNLWEGRNQEEGCMIHMKSKITSVHTKNLNINVHINLLNSNLLNLVLDNHLLQKHQMIPVKDLKRYEWK